MKTIFNRNYRSEIRQHRLPRVRLTPSRRAWRLRTPALRAANVPAKPLPMLAAAIETENIPAESLSVDTLQLYLREIGQVKLLTPQEEITLAKRIRRGDKKAREQMITAKRSLRVPPTRTRVAANASNSFKAAWTALL